MVVGLDMEEAVVLEVGPLHPVKRVAVVAAVPTPCIQGFMAVVYVINHIVITAVVEVSEIPKLGRFLLKKRI